MRISTRRVVPGLALAAAALTLSACGSTVGAGSTGSLSSGGNGIDQGLGLGANGTGASAGTTSSAGDGASQLATGTPGGAATTGSATGAAGSATSTDSGTAAGLPAGSAAFPTSGKGWDAKYVYIGATNQSDVSAVAHSLGLKLDPGNPQADINAIVNDINSHGGIFGRQVKAIVQDNSTAKLSSDPDGSSQATCTFFTQDHKVMALVNISSDLDTDTLRTCMKNNHTPLVSISLKPVDDQTLNRYAPFMFSEIGPSWDVLMPTLIKRLQAQGYFTGWNTSTQTVVANKAPVFGLLYGDTPTATRVGKLMASQLQAAGYKIAATYAYSNNDKDLTGQAVHFKASGVTHIIADGSEIGVMAISAQQQGYYPRYGLTSLDAMQAALEDNTPKKQWIGSAGVGWLPALDTSFAKDPGPVGAGTAHCQQVMAKAGITFTARFAQVVAYAFCDGFGMVKDGATEGRSLEPLAVLGGIQKLGPNFKQAVSFSSGLGPHSFAMPGGARDIAWDTSCSCFSYKGSTYRI